MTTKLLDITDVYLSTSPNTTSRVPMMATMSASMWFLPAIGSSSRQGLKKFMSFFVTNMVGEGEVEEAGSLDLAPVGYNSTVQYSTVHSTVPVGSG